MLKSKQRSVSIFTLLFVFAVQIIIPLFTCKIVYAAEPPQVIADSCLLADLKTGQVFLSKNADVPRIPASLTKILTLFITFDEISLGNLSYDDEVIISEDAWRTGGSKMFVLVGTKVKVSDLIQGITVASGNDACVAIAEHISGSTAAFVEKMNRQAEILGLKTAHFVDPHGISDENRISAQDLHALVIAYITRFPEALKFHAIKEFTYTPPGENAITQFNRNRLLWSYPGVYGLKTGYTSKAGFNLIALADRDGFSTLAIILGSAKGKGIDEGEMERTELAVSLLDYLYNHFSYVELAGPSTDLGKVRVWKGSKKWTEAVSPIGLGATVEKGKESGLTYEVILDKRLEAPLPKNAKVGEAVFTCEGEEVGRMDLISKEEIPKGNIFRIIFDSLARSVLRALGKA